LLYAAIGRVERYDGIICIVTKEGEAGCVLFGPYSVLTPGSYEVEFHAMPHELHNLTCCVVDVLRRGKTIVAEKDFTALELTHRNGFMPVRFEVVEKDIFEFRLTATGTAGLTARYNRPLRLISPLDQGQPEG
jgi:hypothetical protein